MPAKTPRESSLELLRILCMLLIIGDHLTGQGGIADYSTLPSSFAFCLIGCGSRIACSVFVLHRLLVPVRTAVCRTRRPLSLWLSLWLYTVPVTVLCALGGAGRLLRGAALGGVPGVDAAAVVHVSDYLTPAGVHAAAGASCCTGCRAAPTAACCWRWPCR